MALKKAIHPLADRIARIGTIGTRNRGVTCHPVETMETAIKYTRTKSRNCTVISPANCLKALINPTHQKITKGYPKIAPKIIHPFEWKYFAVWPWALDRFPWHSALRSRSSGPSRHRCCKKKDKGMRHTGLSITSLILLFSYGGISYASKPVLTGPA